MSLRITADGSSSLNCEPTPGWPDITVNGTQHGAICRDEAVHGHDRKTDKIGSAMTLIISRADPDHPGASVGIL